MKTREFLAPFSSAAVLPPFSAPGQQPLTLVGFLKGEWANGYAPFITLSGRA
jgi:hypothetical protein